jgi:RNA polymerase sigma factor (TIGR02999 family)
MGSVTTLLSRWNGGDRQALSDLVGLVHGELKSIASGLLREERREHTFQPTDLVHEAYLRLVGLEVMPFAGRAHFYAAAAESMRRILIDHARLRKADKRGGPHRQDVPLDQVLNLPIDLRADFERLDEALAALRTLAPDQARVVDLRYFAGLSIQETATVLDIAPATVKRHWTFARVWLFRAMGG